MEEQEAVDQVQRAGILKNEIEVDLAVRDDEVLFLKDLMVAGIKI